MNSKRLEKLIIRYLSKIISKKEWEELNCWFEASGDSNFFRDYLRINYAIDCIVSDFDKEKKKKKVLEKIKEDKTIANRLRRFNYYKYAAVIIAIFGVSYFLLTNSPDKTIVFTNNDRNEIVESGTNKAILTLKNGNQVALEKGKRYSNDKVSSDGESLIYNAKADGLNAKDIAFNYLTVPRGGQFFLKLSDQTKVWINSDSRIKYPIKFIEGQTRKVELVYGEAYFEVSPSSANGETAFEVLTREQKVSVLGTEFNIRAYKEENQVATTLAGGKVVVEQNNAKKFLKPNQQSIAKDNSDHIDLKEVDVSIMTSWVKGMFIFEEESLGEMLIDLSRWYNVEVFYERQELKEIPFTGILERTNSLNDLLNIIEVISDGEVEFKLKNNLLIVK